MIQKLKKVVVVWWILFGVLGTYTRCADENLMQSIRRAKARAAKHFHRKPPSVLKGTGETRLRWPNGQVHQDPPTWAQSRQDCIVDYILASKNNGSFVEIGGYDGESYSNTLFFERVRGWQGLLIEPNPFTFSQILAKGRTSFAANACVSSSEFKHFFVAGGLTRDTSKFSPWAQQEMQTLSHFAQTEEGWQGFQQSFWSDCYHLHAFMAALRILESDDPDPEKDVDAAEPFHIDYLSIDAEGAEMDVIMAIDFGQMTVDVMTIEVNEHENEIVALLKDEGYETVLKSGVDLVMAHTKMPGYSEMLVRAADLLRFADPWYQCATSVRGFGVGPVAVLHSACMHWYYRHPIGWHSKK